jgi:hypothetical protein
MAVVPNQAVMLDNRAGVDDAVHANAGLRIDDGAGHHNCSGADPGGFVDYRGGMNEYGKRKTPGLRLGVFKSSHAIGTNRHHHLKVGFLIRFLGSATYWALAEDLPGHGRIIIDKTDIPIPLGAARHIQHNFAVAACSPYDEGAHFAMEASSVPWNS